MNNSSNGWNAFVATAVVAIGLAVAWGFAGVWAGSLVATPAIDRIEDCVVGLDGEVYVTSRSYLSWDDLESRTLAGDPVDLTDSKTLVFSQVFRNRESPWFARTPITWSERVVGSSNHAKPAEAWYLVRDPGPEGAAVFEVFDYRSKRRIGYFGKEGMRQSTPPRDEWFLLGEGLITTKVQGNGLVGTGQFASQRYSYGHQGLISVCQWFVVDGDNLLLVDSQKKTVDKVLTLSGIEQVTTISVPFGWLPPRIDWDAAREGAPQIAEVDEAKLVPAIATMILARSRERVVIWNPGADSETVFDLPEELVDAHSLGIAWGGEQQLVVEQSAGNWGGGQASNLYWVDADGQIDRTEHVELAGYPLQSDRKMAWSVAGSAPSPALAALVTFVVAPLGEVVQAGAPSYGAAVQQFAGETSLPFGLIYAAGIACAAIVWRRHTAAHRSHAWRWAALPLLLGPAGLVAYWLAWRGEPQAACDGCGKTVSRRRESCPACDAPWPEPRPLGVEVFA